EGVGPALAPAIPAPRVLHPPVDETQDEVADEPESGDRPRGHEQPRLELRVHAEVSLQPVDHEACRESRERPGGAPAAGVYIVSSCARSCSCSSRSPLRLLTVAPSRRSSLRPRSPG